MQDQQAQHDHIVSAAKMIDSNLTTINAIISEGFDGTVDPYTYFTGWLLALNSAVEDVQKGLMDSLTETYVRHMSDQMNMREAAQNIPEEGNDDE